MATTSSKQCSETRRTTQIKKLSKEWHSAVIHGWKHQTRVQAELWFREMSKDIFSQLSWSSDVLFPGLPGIKGDWLFKTIFFFPCPSLPGVVILGVELPPTRVFHLLFLSPGSPEVWGRGCLFGWARRFWGFYSLSPSLPPCLSPLSDSSSPANG